MSESTPNFKLYVAFRKKMSESRRPYIGTMYGRLDSQHSVTHMTSEYSQACDFQLECKSG